MTRNGVDSSGGIIGAWECTKQRSDHAGQLKWKLNSSARIARDACVATAGSAFALVHSHGRRHGAGGGILLDHTVPS